MRKKRPQLSKTPGAIRSRRYRAKLKKKKKLALARMRLDKKLSKVANNLGRMSGEVVRNTETVDTTSAVMPNEASAML